MATKHGAVRFATGDRIQFTGNGRTKTEKNAGLTNGRVRTVTALAIDDHSAQWRSAASYVALTRHREAVHIFAARETVKDLEAMAKGMARADNKRAANRL